MTLIFLLHLNILLESLTESRPHRRYRHYLLFCNPDYRHTADRRKVSVYESRCYCKRLSAGCFAPGYGFQYMVFLFRSPDIRAGRFQADSPKGRSVPDSTTFYRCPSENGKLLQHISCTEPAPAIISY